MRPSYIIACCLLILISLSVKAQSTLTLRNSTDYTYDISIEQNGSSTISSANYTVHNTSIPGWLEDDQQVVTVDRPNASIPNGDTVYFNALLTTQTDTVRLQLRLAGTQSGSELAYSLDAPDFSHPWHSDSLFHTDTTTLGNKTVAVKYKPENPDTAQSRDILVALQQDTIYTIDSADFQNPNVLNVMVYNIQMLPASVTGLPEAALRSDLLPANFSPWQDVVIFCEVFDNPPRNDYLIPAMQEAGFQHRTTILNKQDGPGVVPTNGGVMIFSRWPVIDQDEIEYSKCGTNSGDCGATKGVKYAAIDKMGKRYHLFGTHMDAGGEQDDIEARRSQISEMRQFIDTLGIPDGEPVIMGGDFNLGPNSSGGLYTEFKDSMNPVVPEPIGFYESTFSGDTGDIIDHAWVDSKHLLPTEATNNILTFRSITDTMWELSEFSDHRSVQGRFVFPDITSIGPDTALCPGDSLSMAVQTDVNVSYQWQRNGQPIANATDTSYMVPNASMSDTGDYACQISYQEPFGTINNNIVNYFYPNGPVNFQANLAYELGRIDDCIVGLPSHSESSMSLYPNPGNGKFRLALPDQLDNQQATLRVYDLQGQLVKQAPIDQSASHIDMQEVGSGTYLLFIQTDKRVWQAKVVIQ